MAMALQIEAWFDSGAPFEEGVALYKSLPGTKANILRSLSRGKNSYNKSLLIKELRAAAIAPPEPPKPKKVLPTPQPKHPTTDASIAKEHHQQAVKTKSATNYFQSVKYAELPAELKVRYREAKDLFYQLCDLKFLLNDVSPKNEKQALAIQLQIEELDEQRTAIWAELEHYKKHKTLLPTETEDYSQLTPVELVKQKANLNSMITKMQKRIDTKYEALIDEDDTKNAIKLERSINNSEKKLHRHRLNLAKIKELL